MKNFDLLKIAYKWKMTLILVVLATAILSVLFSSPFFIQPKYKSTAIIYPYNIAPYSQESPTEQMIQLFQADSVFTHVTEHFNLIKHYDLDTTSPTLQFELLSTYNKNVSIKKTEYEAVKIEVLDTKPEVACGMINEMISAFNANTLILNKKKSFESLSVYKNQLTEKQQQIDSISHSLKNISTKYGIIDYSSQSKELMREYYKNLSTGNEKKINELTNALRNMEELGAKYNEMRLHLDHATEEYSFILTEYNKALTDTQKKITYTNVIVKPVPADKKSYPIRWIIVAISCCSTFLFSYIVILIIEGKKLIDQ